MSYSIDDFDYKLDDSFIAQKPIKPSHHAKMLACMAPYAYQHYQVKDLVDLLPNGAVLVVNNTKTLPALLEGYKQSLNGTKGAKIAINLHQALGQDMARWHVFIKGAKKLKIQDTVIIDHDLSAIIMQKNTDGSCVLQFNKQGGDFFAHLHKIGQMPLPPYIKRTLKDAADVKDYQTIFAKNEGAVATPTASLHFNEEMLALLAKKDIILQEVTLHVGAGTFLPVKVQDISQHQMHSEYIDISAQNAAALNSYKAQGRTIITVGTTSLRALESAANEQGIIEPFQGDTNIFITPSYQFKFCDMLLTNFHLPKSTLLMLVAAFIGLDNAMQMYHHAIENRYRFFFLW